MTKLESLDRARRDADRCAVITPEIKAVIEWVDEIQAEVDERYMELPVDADGVPIRVGDILQLGDTRGEVVALTYCPNNGELPWEWQCDTGDWYNTAFARHVKPRTVEDVLREFAYKVCDLNVADEAISKYAAELRMVDE